MNRSGRLYLLTFALAFALPAGALRGDDGEAIARPPQDAKERARIAELLRQHAAALGPAAELKSLHAVLDMHSGKRRVRGIEGWWSFADRRCVREFRNPKNRRVLFRDHFGPEGAFVYAAAIARHRPNDPLTRGGYYYQAALANPFPLLAFARNPDAGAGALRLGHAMVGKRRSPVFTTQPDEHGVWRNIFLDPDTHHVTRVRYEAKANHPFTEIVYSAYTRHGKVLLPRELYATVALFAEENGGFRPYRQVRRFAVLRYGPIDNPENVPFLPPGPALRRAPGFERTVHETGPAPLDVAVGDLDGDGKQDIAVTCRGGMSVHFGGALDGPVFVELGRGSHHGCEIDDLDGDGRLEAVTMSWTKPPRGLMIVRFDGKRRSTVQVIQSAAALGYRLRLRDLDLDGIPDFVMTGLGPGKPLATRFGNGARGVRLRGQDWPLDPRNEGRPGYGLTIGRIDPDPFADIVVADSQRLLLFQGQPNGAFLPQPSPLQLERPVDLVAVDMNGDGRDDLAVVNDRPPHDGRNELVLVRNTGRGLEAARGLEAGAGVRSIAAGQLNEDDHPDLVVTSYLDGEVRIFPGDGKGGVGPSVRSASGRGATRVIVADVDGDDKDDIVSVNRLDDSVTVHLNRQGKGSRLTPRPARARATPKPDLAKFELKGLADTYDFAGSFRLPLSIPDPSGIAFLGGDDVHSQLVVVSDKKSALFRATLDRRAGRLLVSPPIPLAGLEGERLDLEGIAYDIGHSGTLFLGCEADSSVIRATLFGQVLGRAPTGIPSTGNDGIEGVALRRKKDGTPILYVLKERVGMAKAQPLVRAFDIEESPFALRRRGKDFVLPELTPDQTGATFHGQTMIAVGRLLRRVIEFDMKDDLAVGEPRTASFRALTDGILQLPNQNPLFGVVEGIAVDPWRGDLFLVCDNNRGVVGRGEHRGKEGRLIWFKSRTKGKARPARPPDRVRVRQICIPWDGAVDAGNTKRSRADARKLALALLARLREGEDFGAFMLEHTHLGKFPDEVTVARHGFKRKPGELVLEEIDEPALRRLVFRLEIGETELVEWDREDAPRGWRLVQRIE